MIEFNAEGFLLDPNQWNSNIAMEIAAENNIELTDAHWTVINAVRSFYAKTGISPSMRPLVRLIANEDQTLASAIVLAQLFTPQVTRRVAQISGLPKPSDCI